MKIAIFTDSFIPQVNGVVTATINLAKGLADRGHKVIIIAPKFKGAKEFSYKNIKVKRIIAVPALFYQDFKLASLFSFSLFKFLSKEDVDIINFQTPMPIGLQAIIMAKIFKVPLIGTFHTFFADPQYLKHARLDYKFVQKISWGYARKYYNSCDLVTCPSESTKLELLDHKFKKQIKVISNGIDSKIFVNKKWKSVRKKYSNGGKILLFIGRIAHEKNIFYLLGCFKIVLKKFPETKLLIVGDGPQMQEMKHKIKVMKLNNNVIIFGKMDHNILVKSSIFKACDLFVTASVTENQPMTILEAQANGLVCIGINRRGIGDLIKNGYNGYATAYNKNKFAESIINLLSNSVLYSKMKANTVKEIKKHELSNVIVEWEKQYKLLLLNEKGYIKDF